MWKAWWSPRLKLTEYKIDQKDLDHWLTLVTKTCLKIKMHLSTQLYNFRLSRMLDFWIVKMYHLIRARSRAIFSPSITSWRTLEKTGNKTSSFKAKALTQMWIQLLPQISQGNTRTTFTQALCSVLKLTHWQSRIRYAQLMLNLGNKNKLSPWNTMSSQMFSKLMSSRIEYPPQIINR